MKNLLLAATCALTLVLSSCGGAQEVPNGAKRTVISLDKIDCSECGDKIIEDLRQRPGVYEASFDKRKAEVTVTASPSFDVFMTVKQLASLEGF